MIPPAAIALRSSPAVRLVSVAVVPASTNISSPAAIPLSAVRTDKPTPYVQLVAGNKLVHQPVQLGARAEVDGQTVVIVQGIPDNARLVNGSVGSLREGTSVTLTAGGK